MNKASKAIVSFLKSELDDLIENPESFPIEDYEDYLEALADNGCKGLCDYLLDRKEISFDTEWTVMDELLVAAYSMVNWTEVQGKLQGTIAKFELVAQKEIAAA